MTITTVSLLNSRFISAPSMSATSAKIATLAACRTACRQCKQKTVWRKRIYSVVDVLPSNSPPGAKQTVRFMATPMLTGNACTAAPSPYLFASAATTLSALLATMMPWRIDCSLKLIVRVVKTALLAYQNIPRLALTPNCQAIHWVVPSVGLKGWKRSKTTTMLD